MNFPTIILAGGQSRRFKRGHKALASLKGRPLIEHVISRLNGQVGSVAVNVTSGPLADHLAEHHAECPQLPDPLDWADLGPQAGVRTALRWAAAQGARHVLITACDTPFLPADLADRLQTALSTATGAKAAAVHQPRGWQPLFSLWDTEDEPAIGRLWRDQPGRKSMMDLIDLFRATKATYPSAAPGSLDPFFSINTQDDLARAEATPPPS